jgi:UDP-N-acetylmuramate--alanine ligase
VIRRGHQAGHLPDDSGLVIYSDAIPADNPELRKAHRLGIPTASYFQILGRMMSGKRGLAIAGTHGKSTTAALTSHLLIQKGLDPTVVIGAVPVGWRSGGRLGRSELMVVEACEYRANFLHLKPAQAAVQQIEPDHFDFYRTRTQLEGAFSRFLDNVHPQGQILARHECPTARRLTAALGCRVETFGLDRAADWSAGGIEAHCGEMSFAVYRHGRRLGSASLSMPGTHNVTNALAAAALAWENGVSWEEIVCGLESFRGVCRRLEVVGTLGGLTLVDDFAHHPTEVKSALEAVRQMFPGRRLWCVFQPHQVSRTERLLDGLALSLQNADKVLVSEIFRAREVATDGEVTAADLGAAVRRLGGAVPDAHTSEGILDHLQKNLRSGDVLLTMGAGDIRKIGDELIHRIRKGCAAS